MLRAYTAFALQAGAANGLGGKLLLVSGFGREGISAALGATLAGAACLGMDADAQAVKQAMREGGCDFMVNSLDEALRILKNEVRKKRPVSVGVPADAAVMLAAMVERGVQPDLITDFVIAPAAEVPNVCDDDATDGTAARVVAMRTLVERGATLVDLNGRLAGWFNAGVVSAKQSVEQWAQANGYELQRYEARSGAELKELDKAALEMIAEDDWRRRRWMEQAPKYFRRGVMERWLWGKSRG